ncbi:MAG: membrane-bound lytic murein transglycosylase D [Patiriisocius sp.]|jgi:membrane-bound lytic murein transglycosylase D
MKMMTKIGLVTLLLFAVAVSLYAVQSPKTDAAVTEKIANDYGVHALPMPTYLEFAGEPVPLENPDIMERMDRELHVNTYWQSNMIILMKRANKHFPRIEALLAEHNLPDDFKYLAVAESSLDNVRSPAGAAGFWQFLKGTAKEYNLEVNDYVDERYNIDLATEMAAKYLNKSKDRFGTWTLACAAYNAGNAGVNRQLERQDVKDYYDVLLNSETSRYVFRILAFKEIMSNPKKYGFNLRPTDLYQEIPIKKVVVNYAVEDFAKWSKDQGINYKILKIHNPWLRDTFLKNTSKKEYIIEIPEEGYYQLNK